MENIDSSSVTNDAERAKDILLAHIFGPEGSIMNSTREQLSLTGEQIKVVLTTEEAIFMRVIDDISSYLKEMSYPQFTQFVAEEIQRVMQDTPERE